MGGFSIWHFTILLSFVVWVIAVGRICKRIGFSPFLGILAFFPILNLVLILFIAFARWPVEERNKPLHQTFE